jgi:hypothetical protein
VPDERAGGERPDDVELADARYSAARHAARIVRAFGWAAVLTEPGREPRPAAPLLTDAQRERIAEEAAAEAADRKENLRAGVTALGPSPSPLRPEMLIVRAQVLRTTARLVKRIERASGRTYAGPRLTDRDVVYALDFVAGDGGPPCWAGRPGGPPYRRGVLGEISALTTVEDVGEQLGELADEAGTAVGITTDRIAPYPRQPCPACGRRTLQTDATLANPKYWTVVCISEACRCTGTGCPCRRSVRWDGGRHAWSYGELTGPHGLDRAQAAQRAGHRVGSAAVGHGGWQERRGEPAGEQG